MMKYGNHLDPWERWHSLGILFINYWHATKCSMVTRIPLQLQRGVQKQIHAHISCSYLSNSNKFSTKAFSHMFRHDIQWINSQQSMEKIKFLLAVKEEYESLFTLVYNSFTAWWLLFYMFLKLSIIFSMLTSNKGTGQIGEWTNHQPHEV